MLNYDNLGNASRETVRQVLDGIRATSLTPTDLIFLICRGQRVPLLECLSRTRESEAKRIASSVDAALAKVFRHGGFEILIGDGTATGLWPSRHGAVPVSVALGEMRYLLIGIRMCCPAIWSQFRSQVHVRLFMAEHVGEIRSYETDEALREIQGTPAVEARYA